jgi:hypothetical protein
MNVGVVANLGCGLLLALAGCGQVAVPDDIPGSRVGAMAERELEAENPRMAPGTVDCPDLDLRVGASVRCERTARLSGGRVVRIRGTVAVTSLASGGRLHVAMDDRAAAFGLAGDEIAGALRRTHQKARAVECPYLSGAVGATVICWLRLDDGWHRIDVVVTAVDPGDYRTVYTASPPRRVS